MWRGLGVICRLLTVIFIPLFAISAGKQASATLINFDDLTGEGTIITDQFVSDGIIFDGAWLQIGLSPSRGSAPNWISGELVTNNLSNPDVISGFFVDPDDPSQDATTDYFESLSAFVDSDTTVTLDVFDLDGLLLASVSRVGSSGILSISQTNIHAFDLYHTNSGFNGIDDIIGFDNILFNAVTPVVLDPDPDPTAVPEPSTLTLFATSLVGLGFMMRRRRST